MFMRLLQVKVKPETSGDLPRIYNEKIIPALQQTIGCLYASLIQSVDHPDESISMTLWDTPDHAEAYEQGGLFQRLLHEAEPYLAETSEWKIQLSQDFTLEYKPVREEPVVKSYNVAATAGDRRLLIEQESRMYVRIVSAQLKPGNKEEFGRLYASEILTALRNVRGCRYAFLTEGIEERNEVLSVTIWSSKQDAEAYEASGLFDQLQKKVQHAYSELYQWKMAVERQSGRRVATSDEMIVQGYNVVTGRSFP